MELARLGANVSGAPLTHIKQQVKIAQSVVNLGETLRQHFFENEEFLKNVTSGDDMLCISKLRQLAENMIEEAKSIEFNFEGNRKLLN